MPLSHPGSRLADSVAFRTIGCRLNQCETAQMQEALLAAGFRLVDWDEPADIRVINTCTVTAKSDRTCRHEIHLAKRLDPECVVVVTGCYAQVDPGVIAAIPGVDLVLGNIDKLRLAEHLTVSPNDAPCTLRSTRRPGPTISVSPYRDQPAFEGEFFSHFYGYTRAFLKIQTGCDSRCAYCIVPLARGPARSMPQADVLEQVRLLAARDYREVVLTGINLGDWGRDTGEGSRSRDLLDAARWTTGPRSRRRRGALMPSQLHRAAGDGRLRSSTSSTGPATGWRTTSTCPSKAAPTPFSPGWAVPTPPPQYLEVVTHYRPPLPRRRPRGRRHRRLPRRDRG